MVRYKWLSLLFSLLILSCGKSLPELVGIDSRAWMDDKNGCKGKRINMEKALETEKNKLLALNELQIVKLLGRPDQNELSTRNQKFFYYFIKPSPLCHLATDTISAKLVIRFNAVGLAKEVAIE